MPYESFGAGEQVNLANGGLVIAHPSAISLPQNMGGVLRPTRYYNSKISWTNDSSSTNDLPYGPLGMGWTISYGHIFLRFYGNQGTGLQYADIYYSDESGAEHRLYWQGGAQQSSSVLQHPGTGWYFTNDSSFIRAYYQNSGGADTGLWYLYFPDGSIRVAGETAQLAYIAPQIDSGSPYHLSNKYTNGWYVDQIRDREGNTISIRYMPYSGQPFFGGAIDTITDQGGRTITFDYDANNMLASIQSGSRTESYACSQVDFHIEGLLYVLTSVTDPAGLTTGYAYAMESTTQDDTHLTSISYPTGAVSHYGYTYAPYMTPTQVDDNVLTHTLSFHALDPSGALSGTLNVLAWTFDWPKTEVAFSTRNLTHAVIVTDPLGQETVHLITDGSGLDAGKELVTLRLSPGAVFDSSNPQAGRIYEMDKWYSHGDNSQGQGDAHYCLDDDTAQQVAQGNPRVRLVTETEYGGSGPLWTKTQTNQAWDGFGNYLISEVTGTAINEVVTASAYDLTDTGTPDLTGTDPATVLYQLDHRQMQYAGTSGATMTNSVSTTAALAMSDTQLSDPDPTGPQPFSGQFKAQQASYNGPGGLLDTFTAYEPVQGGFTFDFDHHLLTPVPSPSAGDATQSLTYDGNGNIASIAFSGGEGGHGYTKSLTWQYGVLQQESWTVGPSEISYDSFTRGIDQATGRIVWERDPSGNQTNYSYDADGRITAITPQWSGENGISVAYPNAHTIQYYKGSGSNPQIDPGGTASLADPTGIYTVYSFDDLGRPWRTDTLMPGETWSEKVTLYGPTGAAMFSSLPYTYGGTTTQYTVNGLANSSQFTMAAPAGSGGLSYGTWSVPYSGATGTAPSGPFPGQSSLDPFYRTMEVLGPDGSHTDTAYSGLSSYVTVNNVNGDPVAGTGTSGTTTYTKDVLGELLSVSPPVGATASYGYDGLQHLHTVTQGSQPSRTFTYDARGHLRSAQLPESGLSSYTQYDAMGNLVQYTDGASQTFTKTYDSRGRQRALSLGSTVLLQWFYDEGGTSGYGHLTRADSYINADGTAQVEEAFTYDGLGGRLGHESLSLNLPSLPPATYTASLSYDPQGQVTNETDARGTAFASYTTTEYRYGLPSVKRFGSAQGLTDRSGVQALSYWPSGAIDVLTFDNGTTTTFTQDTATGRLAELRWQGTGNSWDSGAYQYDGIGEVTRMGSDSFSYDVTGRLTGATIYHPHTNGTSADFGYTYDPYGNLQTVTSSSASFPSLTTFGVDSSTNHLTSITGQTYAPSYDANGNMTNDGVNTLQYDQLNRVTSLGPTGGSSTTYYYDAAGERVAAVNGNSPTYFFRIGPQVRLQENFANAGTPSQSYAKTFLYVGGHLAASEEGNVAGGGTGSYTISGAVTLNGPGLPGVRVTAGSASATTQSDGSYTLSGLAAGTYTVTPALSGYTFTPASQSETITNANITTVNFTATASPSGHAIKGTVTLNGSGLGGVTITVTPNVQTYTITASAGTGGSISPSGSVQVASGSSQTFAITPTGGYQIASVIVDGANVGAVSTYAFTNVTANHSISASFSPSTGSYSISGTITYNGAGLSGVTVTAGSASTTTNSSGAYTLSGLSTGTYTVAPSLSGYAFSPSSASETINNANITGVNFTASAVGGGSYSISGRVTVTSTLFGRIVTRGVRGVTVRAGSASAITDFRGNYTISGLSNGTYSVTAGTNYSPSSQSVTINGASVTGVNFTSEVGTNGPVRAEAVPETSVITNPDGSYTVSGLADGSYTVTPSLSGYTFSPASQTKTVSGADVTGINFTATPPASLTASAYASPTTGPAPLAVSFSGSATGGTAPYAYSWAFGDGSNSTSQNPSHTYSSVGNYTAALTVTDSTSATATATVNLNVTAQTLTAYASGSPTSGTAPLTVSFGGSATGGTPPYTYSWAFGDGSTSASQNPSHTYTGTGTYAAVLTVTDSASQAGQATVTITATSAVTYSISGTVTITACGQPLSGVTVSAGAGTPGTTDSAGNYTITGLPNGTYTLTASLAS
ncbi:MAG: PKD domain-containing protein, partial [Acidobacteriota bacterium]